MSYLITQIVVCLLLAALLGGLAGWLLRALYGREQAARLVADYERRLRDRRSLERERDRLTERIQGLERENVDLNAKLLGMTIERDRLRQLQRGLTAGPGGDRLGLSGEYEVEEIQGIGRGFGRRLRELGITTTLDLLEAGNDPEQREAIAETTGVAPFVVRKWVSMADLLRVPGVGGREAELLEAAGILSVPQLARQEAFALAHALSEINAREHRAPEAPTVEQVRVWIAAARELPERLQP